MKISEAEAVSVKLKEFEKQVSRWTGAHTCSQKRSSIPFLLTLEESETDQKVVINSLSKNFFLQCRDSETLFYRHVIKRN